MKQNHFQAIIVDESHYLKNRKAKRTQGLVPLVQQARRAVLLTGTPALSRPEELYPQLEALRPGMFGSFTAFATRYCDGHRGRFGWDTKGASNLAELHQRLREHVMIRRLKKDVLTQLPAKRRQRVAVEVRSKKTQESLSKALRELRALGDDDISERNRLMTQLYKETGTGKLEAVKEVGGGGSSFVFYVVLSDPSP